MELIIQINHTDDLLLKIIASGTMVSLAIR